MRISALAAQAGLPVATVKFYLRERLLHEGELTSATQAQYDESHVRRLQLVRALLGPADLSVAEARRVVATLDAPPPDPTELLGVAQHAVARERDPDVDTAPARAAADRWGWSAPDGEELLELPGLAEALAAVDAAGFEVPEGNLDLYAEHITAIAHRELDGIPVDSLEGALRYVVLGTVLIEPVLLAMRRVAHEAESRRRYHVRRPD
jgi:DNA-binding transcriptional MerR regulator